jgi:hypothetical protein
MTGEGELTGLPSEFPLAVGDALQCLRQSLDHALHTLALQHNPELEDKAARQLYFPANATRATKLPIDPAAQSLLIEYLEADLRLAPERRTLSLLVELSNTDRHRLIPSMRLATITYTPVDETSDRASFYSADAFWDLVTLGLATSNEPSICRRLDFFLQSVGKFLQGIDKHLEGPSLTQFNLT